MGVAPVERFAGAPSGHHPQSFLSSARSVIVVGIPIPEGVLAFPEMMKGSELIPEEMRMDVLQGYYYRTSGYDIINRALEDICLRLTLTLEEEGFRSLYFAPTFGDQYSSYYDKIRMGLFSNRHAAARAGLGEFGLNNLIVNPNYGPRVRYASIITAAELPIPEESWEYDKPGIGEQEHPLFYRYHSAQANLFARSVLEGKPYPLKAMVIAGSNPALTWPNSNRVREALSRLDFLTVFDQYMTETAKLGDLVLPVGGYWCEDELWEICQHYSIPVLGLSPKLPLDNNRPGDWQFWRNIVVKMGYEHKLPWKNKHDYFNYRLSPLNITVNHLMELPDGISFVEKKEKSYSKEGFNTKTGKVELLSPELSEYGYNPLPIYKEPTESPVSTPELFKIYPMVASTGNRISCYMHSRFRNITDFRRYCPEPEIEIHPSDADCLGVNSGDFVILKSSRGSIKARAKINEDTIVGIIFISHGWEESNANCLTADDQLDPVTGFPPNRSFLARIIKSDEQRGI